MYTKSFKVFLLIFRHNLLYYSYVYYTIHNQLSCKQITFLDLPGIGPGPYPCEGYVIPFYYMPRNFIPAIFSTPRLCLCAPTANPNLFFQNVRKKRFACKSDGEASILLLSCRAGNQKACSPHGARLLLKPVNLPRQYGAS